MTADMDLSLHKNTAAEKRNRGLLSEDAGNGDFLISGPVPAEAAGSAVFGGIGPEPCPRDSVNSVDRGFTMIELLIAMVLISMVTLAASVAMRLTINAWERGVKEGEEKQILTALPGLLENQLAGMVVKAPVADAVKMQELEFCGEKNGLSIFTAYAPRGSMLQGLLRVTWIFDEETGTLTIFQKRIGGKDDLKEEFNPLSDRWNEESAPVSRVTGIDTFSFAYAKKGDIDVTDRDKWEEKWPCGKAPARVRVEFELAGDKAEKPFAWFFPLGMAGL